MARKVTVGFEKSAWSTVADWQTAAVAGGAAISLSSSPARIGGQSGRLQCATAGTLNARQNIYSGGQTTVCYLCVYIYIATLPAADTQIMNIQTTGNAIVSSIQLKTDGTLAVLKADGTQLGSVSAALSTSTWYRVELKHDATTNPGALEARYVACPSGVDPGSGETTIASGANSAQGTWGRIAIGSTVSTTLDIYFDDLAFNDTSGSQQTSWPGNQHTMMLLPNAGGDANQWLDNTGAAGTSNNYTLLDEVTINTTDYVKSNTLNNIDFYNFDNSGLSASDTINVVEPVYRYANDVAADATTAFKFQIIKASAGTVAQSAAIVPNGTGFTTSNVLISNGNDLKMHLDPDGNPWTNTTVDSLQAGPKLTATGANGIKLTTVWVLVNYTPAVASTFKPIIAMM